ncbi:PadR family transcriptional regulator [Pseudomonas matsuisoli]|uniref:PadR family transcriptional regulator n=1 Tax=Pseudomonas matsuisoli TaxID=1515666 RepID=A0A917Q1I1_9PSED|nr:PadR family transcriptional regulator [Pseudomonas matsuisoli]GGK04405.1 PadR family transcriptional regulator [Pseudomonas matsuisoli]
MIRPTFTEDTALRGGRERGPRVFAPGDLKLLLMELIAIEPRHGYDLIRHIESMFEGAYSPSPGVIYPTLTFLEESEWITGESHGGKKRYEATAAGHAWLADQAVALEGMRTRIDLSRRALAGHSRPPEIHEAVGNLRHALRLHHGRWTAAEIERVSRLLNETARAIAAEPTLSNSEEPSL